MFIRYATTGGPAGIGAGVRGSGAVEAMESGGVPKTCCICGAACPDTPPMRDPLRRVMCVKCSAAGAKLPPVREAAPAAPESGLIGLENIGPDELERLMEAEAAAAGSAATLAPSPPPASTGQGRKCPYC